MTYQSAGGAVIEIPRKGSHFVYVQEVDRDLCCGICKYPLFQPQESECEHYFCMACIEDFIDECGMACPICGEALSKRQPYRRCSRLIRVLVDKLICSCDRHDDQGKTCGATFRRDHFHEHAKVCEFVNVQCPQSCGDTVMRYQLPEHEAGCAKGKSSAPSTDTECDSTAAFKAAFNIGSNSDKYASSPPNRFRKASYPTGRGSQTTTPEKEARFKSVFTVEPLHPTGAATPGGVSMDVDKTPGPRQPSQDRHVDPKADMGMPKPSVGTTEETAVPEAHPQPTQPTQPAFQPPPPQQQQQPLAQEPEFTLGADPLEKGRRKQRPRGLHKQPSTSNNDSGVSSSQQTPLEMSGLNSSFFEQTQPSHSAPTSSPECKPETPLGETGSAFNLDASTSAPVFGPAVEQTQPPKQQNPTFTFPEGADLGAQAPPDTPEQGSKAAKKGSRGSTSSKTPTSKKLKMGGDDAYERGDYEHAIELWTQAIEVNDGTAKLPVVYGNRSAARFMSQQYMQCIEDCKKALEDEKGSSKLWTRMCKAACFMGRIELAITLLQNAQHDPRLKEADPKELELVESERRECIVVNTALQAAAKHIAGKAFEQAEGEVSAHFAKHHDWPQVAVAYAEVKVAKRMGEEAGEIVSKFLCGSKSPASIDSEVLSRAYLVKARSLYLKGFDQMKEAIRTSQEGLSFAPDHTELKALEALCTKLEDTKERGNDLFRSKEWARSAEIYTEGLGIAGDTCPEVTKVLYTNRAAARKEMKQYRLAIDDCTSALSLDSQFTRAYTRRGRCHLELQDCERALADFRMAQKYGGTNSALEELINDAERRKAKDSDYYTLFGMSRSMDFKDDGVQKQLKNKYKELCLRWHPDKVHGVEEERKEAERKIKMVNEAYAILCDPARKKEYDHKLQQQQHAANMKRSSFPYHGSGVFAQFATRRPFGY
eukprot:Sspe_Gene.28423::Locus_12883_Transcript_1_1_Confidence_1.000_Length_3268::g.28423::m.28423/K09527/DNAJC7; DnaJ homolog subfamily C member 7